MVSDSSVGTLRVAAATVDLTPPAGLPMVGYLQREGKVASGTHDPLEARLIWLRDPDGGEVLWCAIDAVAVDRELAGDLAGAIGGACGCATDAVLVCATHTHSGPAGWVRSLGPTMPDMADDALRHDL